MSGRHEQKYLLHNWSDRCYRDRPQNPRAVLSARPGGEIAPKERSAENGLFRFC